MYSIKKKNEEGREKPNHNMKYYILEIKGYEIFDSSGVPTVEIELRTGLGAFRAAVPAGASTGDYEALERRDNGRQYRGKGVNWVISLINDVIGPALIKAKYAIMNQEGIDQFLKDMDGTKNMSKLGVNAILGISMAVCKACAAAKNVPLWRHIADMAGTKNIMLPVPAFNVIDGGKDTSNGMLIQEFMIMPTGAKSFSEAMQYGTECYEHLKDVITERYGAQAISVGEEGGFTPKLQTDKEALCLIQEAIQRSCLRNKMQIAIDVAASNFYTVKKVNSKVTLTYYNADFKNPKPVRSPRPFELGLPPTKKEVCPHHMLQPKQLRNIYKELIAEFPICSIEDPFHKDDWKAWQKFNNKKKNSNCIR